MQSSKYDIHKAAGIIIKDKKILVEKSINKDFFISPGGSIEKGETAKQALVRELKEEFNVKVSKTDLTKFGTFFANAAGQESRKLKMEVFIVKKWIGKPTPNMEVEKIMWIDSNIPKNIKVGSIFQHDVIPKLKNAGLIN